MPSKKIICLCFLLQGLFLAVHPQQASDSAVYNKGIQMIWDSKTTHDYKLAAVYFEDLSANYPSHWLSYYYAALCYIKASYKAEEDRERDKLLDLAQPLIDKAGGKNPKEPEIMVLQAFLYQSRIQVNPTMRGMTYSSKAEAILRKATGTDNRNPRAWSLLGYNLYYTPVIFGGGPEKALPLFIKARDKFSEFKSLMPFYPQWGETENRQMIEECKKSGK